MVVVENCNTGLGGSDHKPKGGRVLIRSSHRADHFEVYVAVESNQSKTWHQPPLLVCQPPSVDGHTPQRHHCNLRFRLPYVWGPTPTKLLYSRSKGQICFAPQC